MNRYRDIIGRINYGLFLAFVALLPFPQIFIRYACVFWFVFWVLEGRWLSRPLPVRENRIVIPIVLFGLWYGWKAVSGLWAPDHAVWSGQMERYLTFALMIPVGIWGVNKRYDWRTAGKVLIVSCIAAVPFYPALLAYLWHHPETAYALEPNQPWHYEITEWWPFFQENVSFMKHRLFLCSVELFGLICAFVLYHKRVLLFLPAAAVMLSTVPLTGSRQSILTAAAIVVIGLIYALPERLRLRYGIAVILIGLVGAAGMLSLHPRMADFSLRNLTQITDVSVRKPEPRLNIWGLALENPSDYMTVGLGAGQSTPYLIAKYKATGFDDFAQMRYNAHNQYLEELMEGGIPGLVLIILAWLAVPICAMGKGKMTAIPFFVLYTLNMLTDCMFGRFCGIALWAVGLLFILLQSHAESEE